MRARIGGKEAPAIDPGGRETKVDAGGGVAFRKIFLPRRGGGVGVDGRVTERRRRQKKNKKKKLSLGRVSFLIC